MLVPSAALKSDPFSSSASRLTWCIAPIELLVCLSLFAVAICSTNVFGQETADEDVIRVSTDLSIFPIRVTDKSRHAVSGLTVADFQLQDGDGITTSLYFASGADRVALSFVLDQSGSLREIVSQQRDAALALLDRFGKGSRVAVIRFDERPETVVPFGTDSEAARAAFNFRSGVNRRTAIFDAAAAAVRTFGDFQHDPTERRIVILISDGLDNASSTSPAGVIAAAQTKNISFYTIQIPLFEPRDGRLAVRGPSKGFRDLAEKTGGKYFLVGDARTALEPTKTEDLGPVFRAIEEDLKSQYVVGFYVAEKARDGKDHRVSISIMPSGLNYSVAQSGRARTHQFSVRLAPRNTVKSPQ